MTRPSRRMAFFMRSFSADTTFRAGPGGGDEKTGGGRNAAHNHAHLRPSASKPHRQTRDSGPYFGGGGAVKISRLRPGSGFGFGLGAFLVSFLPLSLFPMHASMTQKAVHGKVLQSPAFQPDASRAFASALKSGPVRADAADQCWLCRQSQYSFFSSSLRFLKSL